MGDVNVNSYGKPCLNWQRIYYWSDQRDTILDILPDTSWESLGNKCRSVHFKGKTARQWIYNMIFIDG